MANKTITLKSQKCNVLGPTPTEQWGTGTWNTMKWGTNTWGIKSAGAGGIPALIFRASKSIKSQSLLISCPASSIFRNTKKVFSKPLYSSMSIPSIYAMDGHGFKYVFNDWTTNFQQESIFTYADISQGTSVSYTDRSAASGQVSWTSGA